MNVIWIIMWMFYYALKRISTLNPQPFRFLPYFKETVLDEIKDVFRTDLR